MPIVVGIDATLAALCEALACQPGDLLRWKAEDAEDAAGG